MKSVEVLHNPPVLFAPGDVVDLEFQFVCPGAGTHCPAGAGEVTVTQDSGEPVTLKSAFEEDGVFTVEVPREVTKAGGFSYAASFDLEGRGTFTWPTASPSMTALAMTDAHTLDLGTPVFDGSKTQPGDLVTEAGWGEAEGQFGRDEVGVGPTSFDVLPSGQPVVLDTVKSRLVWTAKDGVDSNQGVKLPQDFPDMAVEPDGTIDVLAPNGGGTGNSVVLRFTAQGEPLGEVATAAGRGSQIRARGNTVFVLTQASTWVPVVRDGTPLSIDEQAGGTTQAASQDGNHVFIKHAGDGLVLLEKTTGGNPTAAWQLKADAALGPIILAEPTEWGMVVVQSVYSDEGTGRAILQLFDDGATRVTWAPYEQFAEMTASSDFRWAGGALYAARSSTQGFAIYRYDLTEETR